MDYLESSMKAAGVDTAYHDINEAAAAPLAPKVRIGLAAAAWLSERVEKYLKE